MAEKPVPEWAANAKTIHAWRPWIGRDNRRWGFRALCGTTSRYDFGWSMRVDEPGAEQAVARCYAHLPMCRDCRDRVRKSTNSGSAE